MDEDGRWRSHTVPWGQVGGSPRREDTPHGHRVPWVLGAGTGTRRPSSAVRSPGDTMANAVCPVCRPDVLCSQEGCPPSCILVTSWQLPPLELLHYKLGVGSQSRWRRVSFCGGGGGGIPVGGAHAGGRTFSVSHRTRAPVPVGAPRRPFESLVLGPPGPQTSQLSLGVGVRSKGRWDDGAGERGLLPRARHVLPGVLVPLRETHGGVDRGGDREGLLGATAMPGLLSLHPGAAAGPSQTSQCRCP